MSLIEKGRMKRPAKVTHLMSQAQRARKFAESCELTLVEGLWLAHAQLCERNLEAAKVVQRRKYKRS